MNENVIVGRRQSSHATSRAGRGPTVGFFRHVAPPICPNSIGAPQKTRKFSKFLIANEVHSRKFSTPSQHSTYEFLIANEFQSQSARFRPAREQFSGVRRAFLEPIYAKAPSALERAPEARVAKP